jgi:hypothetical protein
MIRKIGNLSVGKTDEQEIQLWAEVLSHRNKLLSNSDWTQVPDSGLTPECVEQWRNWRKSLKAINRVNFGDRDLAEQTITKLSRRIPFNVYIAMEDEPNASRYVSLEEYRKRVTAYLDAAFNKRCEPTFLDNPVLVEEQFREALDYLTKKDENRPYPLISVTVELYGMSHKAVADEFVARKVALMKRLANLKQKYFYFQSLVRKATTDVELSEVQAEIQQWISTST